MEPLSAAASYDMAVVGNSIFAALIDSQAKVVWACFPRLDSDPVFNSLVNNNSDYSVSGLLMGKGFFDVQVENVASSQQSYEGNEVLILKTRIKTKE